MPALRADTSATRIFATTCVALALLCLSASSASAQAAAPSSGGASFIQQPVNVPGGAFAGKSTVVTGHVDGYTGPVSITARRNKKQDFLPVGTAQADAAGDFSFSWKPPKSGLYSVRLTPVGVAASAAAQTDGSIAVYRRQKATWYGPGFYGSRTACGQKLTRRTLGVAHKTLPCGTRVEFFLRGKRITVPVIDRGPFANRAVWDLTLAAMRRLGSSSTEFVGALPVG